MHVSRSLPVKRGQLAVLRQNANGYVPVIDDWAGKLCILISLVGHPVLGRHKQSRSRDTELLQKTDIIKQSHSSS